MVFLETIYLYFIDKLRRNRLISFATLKILKWSNRKNMQNVLSQSTPG